MKVFETRDIFRFQHVFARLETYWTDPGVRLRVGWRWFTRHDPKRSWKKNGGTFSIPVPSWFWTL